MTVLLCAQLPYRLADKRDEQLLENLLHIRLLRTFNGNLGLRYLAADPVG